MWQVDRKKIGKKRTIKGVFRYGALKSKFSWQQQKNQPAKERCIDKLPAQNIHALVGQEEGRYQKEQV